MKRIIDEVMLHTGFTEESAREILDICHIKTPQKDVKTVMPVEVYSRVVGYFRPVNQWNNGKREEFLDRKTFKVKI